MSAGTLAFINTIVRAVRMRLIWNFIRIEHRIEYRRNFEYESNIESNKNIQWLQIRLEYTERCRDVLPGSRCRRVLREFVL